MERCSKNGAISTEGRCYLDFLRDLDIECVGTYGRWAYLRRPRDGAPFDLFSDIDSKIAHLLIIAAEMLRRSRLRCCGVPRCAATR